jgi:signal transduction histidine kinase
VSQPFDVHRGAEAAAPPTPQNEQVRSRLLRLWRAAEPTPWPDVALAAVLGVGAAWLTVTGAQVTNDAPMPPFPPWEEHPGLAVPAPDREAVTGDAVLNLLAGAALAGRRRWPLACFALQFTLVLGFGPAGNALLLTAVLVGAYSLAVHGRSAPLSIGVLLAAATLTAALESNTWPSLPGWVGIFALLLPVGLAGVAIRAARGRARASDERAESLRREQDASTRLAVAEERARIARELHDVVSHHVSVMTIQAGAAGRVLGSEPELARGALSAVEASGRETMAELRHLLGVLSPAATGDTHDTDDDLLHPQPGLDQLDALVENVRRAGQPVSVRRTAADLPRGLDLTAYRVVQEALTNALRYAPGARTEIAISTEPPADLVIEVTNDAVPPGVGLTGAVPEAGSGTGLLGLAERLRLYGGTLETGRRAGGGFRVRARMPLGAAA